MRNGKHILSMDKAARGETKWLECCWDECEKLGTSLHRTRFHDHPPKLACDSEPAKHVWYVFCSERHRQLFLHSHVENGKLPSGSRSLSL